MERIISRNARLRFIGKAVSYLFMNLQDQYDLSYVSTGDLSDPMVNCGHGSEKRYAIRAIDEMSGNIEIIDMLEKVWQDLLKLSPDPGGIEDYYYVVNMKMLWYDQKWLRIREPFQHNKTGFGAQRYAELLLKPPRLWEARTSPSPEEIISKIEMKIDKFSGTELNKVRAAIKYTQTQDMKKRTEPQLVP